MALQWSGIERDRFAETAALLCSTLLAALALWLLVRIVWALVPRGDAAIDTAPARTSAAGAAAAPASSIANWHLFGAAPLRPVVDRNAPATTLSLILRGTVSERDAQAGIAVIADPQQGERAFRVGDEVMPGTKLGAVYADHVVLIHEGTEETLTLPRTALNATTAPSVSALPSVRAGIATPFALPAQPAAPTPSSSLPAASTSMPALDKRQTLDQLRRNPGELARRVQIAPVLDGGKLAGVRLSAGADTALLKQLGLQPGDVVTRVNGVAIDSFSRGQEIMSTLNSAQSVRATVLRDGKPIDVTVGLK